MSKRLPLSAAVSVAMLIALPTVSEANDCLHLHRIGTRTVAVVDGAGRAVTRVGDGVVRVGERAFGWIFCDRHRA
jgi:hypothetical protein